MRPPTSGTSGSGVAAVSAEEITPAEALEVFDEHDALVLAAVEVELDGAPAAVRRACERALGDDAA